MDTRVFLLLAFLLLGAGCTAPRPAGSLSETSEAPASEAPASEASATAVSVTPERPQAGRRVTVTYHPQAQGARLSAPDTLELVVRSEAPDPRVIPMKKKGPHWTAHFTPGPEARFLRFYVQSDSVRDRNGAVGWGRMIYGADGRPVRGAQVARADFLREQPGRTSSRGAGARRTAGANRDSLMQEEEAYQRELARFPDHLVARAHLRALQAERDSTQAQALRQEGGLEEIDAARTRHAGDPQKLREVQRAYYALGRKKQAQAVGTTLAELAPHGPEAELAAFRRATADGMSAARARRRADAFLERFPQSFFRSGVYESLFETYRAVGKTEAMLRAGRRWIQAEQVNPMRAHRAVAQALAGAGRYETALVHARRAIEAASEAPSGYTLYKSAGAWDWAPTPLTPKQRRERARRQRGRQRAMLGRIHYRSGHYAKAAEVLAQAVKERPAGARAWAHLARAYEKIGQTDRAYAAVEQALRQEPSLRPARSLFRRLYIQRHGSDEGLGAAVARLARGKLLDERLNQDAPAFRLAPLSPDSTGPDSTGPDLLRAEALEGKVVVLDFWASWCGPCQVAFPHLQAVYEKYRDAPDVQFLVVNTTWNERRARARRFIEKNGYTFPTYWDAGSRVTRAFGIDSIPATILIGKEGRVQFRETGFGGAGHYEKNLSMRIDLLRDASK